MKLIIMLRASLGLRPVIGGLMRSAMNVMVYTI